MGSDPRTEAATMSAESTVPDRSGVWVAYFHDRSAVVMFGTEIDALRYALDQHMNVKFMQFGETL